MSYTDPSGYFFKKLFGGLAKSVFRAIGQNKFLSSVISIGLYFVPGCGVWCSAAFNAATTYAVTGSLKAAAIGFAAGAISPGGFDPTAFLIRGAIGGLANRALGGNFGHGFIAAGASGAAGGIQNPWGRILASAVIGGTVSKITGGKFANGATSAAFATAVQAGFKGEFSNSNDRLPKGGGDVEVDENTPTVEDNAIAGERAVYAVKDGKVFRAGWQDPNNHKKGLGFRISISDEDGYTQYGHMDPDSLSVSAGDTVKRGDYLGEYASPTNGSSSGPHVHIESRNHAGKIITPPSFSPLNGGRVTAPFRAIDNMHKKPHQGIDYAY